MIDTGQNYLEQALTKKTFRRDSFSDIAKLAKEPIIQVLGTFSVGLTGIALLTSGYEQLPISFIAAFLSGPSYFLSSVPIAQHLDFPPIFELYPKLEHEDYLKKITSALEDRSRGYLPARTSVRFKRLGTDEKDAPINWRDMHTSVVKYKKRIITEIGKYAQKLDLSILIRLVQSIPDPDLKLHVLKSIVKYGKDDMKEVFQFLESERDKSHIYQAAYGYLKHAWGQDTDGQFVHEIDQISQLEDKHIYSFAEKITPFVLDRMRQAHVFDNTLIPFVRLYCLRRIKEELAQNNFPNSNSFQQQLSDEVLVQLTKSNRALKELKLNPECPTSGLEIQPASFKEKETPLTVDEQDVKSLIKYAQFRKSSDKPFEFVFPPNKNPILQLLLLREVILLTGLNTATLGAQINFGGIGRVYTTPTALQRVIFASGILQDSTIGTEGNYWNIGKRGNAATKGETSIRTRGNPLTKGDVVDLGFDAYPEFSTVGELRAGFGAPNFFSFSNGFLKAHRMATYAKAYEKYLLHETLTEREQIMAIQWETALKQMNTLLAEYNIPNCDLNWSKEIWINFAHLIEDNKFNKKIKKILYLMLHSNKFQFV